MLRYRALLTLASLLLLALPLLPRTQGAVHHIDVTHVLEAARISHSLHPHAHVIRQAQPGQVRPNREAMQRNHQAEVAFHTGKGSADGTPRQLILEDITTTEPLSIDDWGSSLLGNVTLGTPAQSFQLKFELSTSNLYVLDANAQYYSPYAASSSAYSDVTDKQTYDSTASTSYAASNANYSTDSTYYPRYPNGSVVSDTMTVGSLTTTVSFEDVSVVRSYMSWYNYDGVFGLSNIPDANATTTLLGQLQSSLDSPVFTYNMVYTNYTDWGSGQLVLGGLAPDTCQSDWTQVANTSGYVDYYFPDLIVSGVSTTAVGDTSGCTLHIDVPTIIDIYPYFGYMYTSSQMLELFVQASNATFNYSTYQYELSADQLAAAQPIYFTLAMGGTIRLDPDDYVAKSDTGVNYLNIYGSYDAHKSNMNYLGLGVSFLNNHCLSKNFQTGIWSVANTVKDTEIVEDPSTTTQGPNSVN